jgi:3-isopropylmalate dehydratase small subunit
MAIAIVAIAAVTVVSRQKARVNEANNPKKTTVLANASKNQSNFMTVKVAGQDVQVDPQTGQIQKLTPEETQRMAAGLKKMINQSSEGLVQIQHADGTVSMDMEDRFQNVPVARINKDGSVSQSCVDNPKAAGEFFGINPKLIEKQP